MSPDLEEAHRLLREAHRVYQEALRVLIAQSEQAYEEALAWSQQTRTETTAE